jgi:hypothetical protein
MTIRAFLGIPLVVSLAALACQDSNSVTGPNVGAPTPTPMAPAVTLAGDWVGVYQADPTICQTFNLAAATASFTENGSALSGNLTSTQGGCPTAVRLQAVRNGNSFSGTASQLGYTGTATGHLDVTDLVIEVSELSNGTGRLPSGKAQLHRP